MSVQVAVPQAPRKHGLRHRLRARAAVVAAFLIVSRLPLPKLRSLLAKAQRGTRRPATAAEAADAHDLVTSVSVRCAGPACLERSVAVLLLCASCRIRVCWCVGVRTPPFESHAWVEAAGEPVREPGDVHRIYTTILRM